MKWIVFLFLLSIGFFGWSFYGKRNNIKVKNEQQSVKGSYSPVILLELFTSEGCSSCPPADNLSPRISKINNSIISLSFHVDYWNKLGWTDRFSQKEFSDRQRVYARQFRLNSIYTPQLVVNGTYEMVGSNQTQAESAIKKSLNEGSSVKLDLENIKNNKNKLSFEVSTQGDIVKMNLLAAIVQKHVETFVKAGENKDARLIHTNVVRSFKSSTANENNMVEIDIPANITEWQLVVYTQRKDNLKITGGIIYQPPNY